MLLFVLLWSLEVPILVLIHKHLWLLLPGILSKCFVLTSFEGFVLWFFSYDLFRAQFYSFPFLWQGTEMGLMPLLPYFSPQNDKLWGNLCSWGLGISLSQVQQTCMVWATWQWTLQAQEATFLLLSWTWEQYNGLASYNLTETPFFISLWWYG